MQPPRHNGTRLGYSLKDLLAGKARVFAGSNKLCHHYCLWQLTAQITTLNSLPDSLARLGIIHFWDLFSQHISCIPQQWQQPHQSSQSDNHATLHFLLSLGSPAKLAGENPSTASRDKTTTTETLLIKTYNLILPAMGYTGDPHSGCALCEHILCTPTCKTLQNIMLFLVGVPLDAKTSSALIRICTIQKY